MSQYVPEFEKKFDFNLLVSALGSMPFREIKDEGKLVQCVLQVNTFIFPSLMTAWAAKFASSWNDSGKRLIQKICPGLNHALNTELENSDAMALKRLLAFLELTYLSSLYDRLKYVMREQGHLGSLAMDPSSLRTWEDFLQFLKENSFSK